VRDALPEVLVTLRQRAGLTRRDAAGQAGLSVNTLTALEQGKTSDPGFFKVARAARAYATSLDDLVSFVEIRARRAPVTKQKEPKMSHGVVSAGYEGRTIEGFVESLVSLGVTAVADVRLNAISRKAGFSKGRLRSALAEADIDYLHFRTLGNPKENREPFWTGRLQEGRAVYRELLAGDDQSSALTELGELADHGVVAILCFEQDHERCHRQVVIDELTTQAEIPVHHLPAEV
jgi:transcriptional regulator with XRE-family HTH domain